MPGLQEEQGTWGAASYREEWEREREVARQGKKVQDQEQEEGAGEQGPKRDTGNKILKKYSKTASAIFSACNHAI